MKPVDKPAAQAPSRAVSEAAKVATTEGVSVDSGTSDESSGGMAGMGRWAVKKFRLWGRE